MDSLSEEILLLAKKKAKEQGAYSHDEFSQIVDETIEYFKEKGKMVDEDNDEFIKDQIMEYHENFINKIGD